MTINLIDQYDAVEVNLTQLYNFIKTELTSQHIMGNVEVETLLKQQEDVKGLLWNVRATLRDLAPELYPEF
jgi:hypothetical protein